MKLVKCICDNSRWMESLESATVKITSPKGNSIRIKKCRMPLLTEGQRELVFRAVGDELTCNLNMVVMYNRLEMALLFNISLL